MKLKNDEEILKLSKKIKPIVRGFLKHYTVDCENIYDDYRANLKKEEVLKLKQVGEKNIALPERGYKAQVYLNQYNVLDQLSEEEIAKTDFYEVNLKSFDLIIGDKILANVKLYSKTPKTYFKTLGE